MTTPALGTPARIITYGMVDAGLLQEGDEPNSEQLASGMNRLNDIFSLWQTQGIKLFLLADQSVTLVASQRDYTFFPTGDVNMTKPLRAEQGYYLDSSDVRRPIYPLSWDEWMRLSQTTAEGSISQYFVDKQYNKLQVSFWLTPDSTTAGGTAHLMLRTQAAKVTGLTDTIQFPPEWYMALRWAYADEICTGQPQAIMDRCKANATVYRQMLEDWDVEDTDTTFVADTQRGYPTGSFR